MNLEWDIANQTLWLLGVRLCQRPEKFLSGNYSFHEDAGEKLHDLKFAPNVGSDGILRDGDNPGK